MLCIIGVIIGIIIGVVCLVNWHDWVESIEIGTLAVLAFGLPAILLSTLIRLPFIVEIPEVKVVEKPIYALQDNFNTSGAYTKGIFYGTGYINEDLNYYFITNTDKGRKIMHQKADNTYIKSTTESPTIEYHYKDIAVENKIVRIICWPVAEASSRVEDYCVLNVPENAITTEMSIDLQ